jgi:hypothetical protein
MPVSASEFLRRVDAGLVQAESRFTLPVNATMASGVKIGNLIVTAISDVVHLGGGTIGFNYIGSVTGRLVDEGERLGGINFHSTFGTMLLQGGSQKKEDLKLSKAEQRKIIGEATDLAKRGLERPECREILFGKSRNELSNPRKLLNYMDANDRINYDPSVDLEPGKYADMNDTQFQDAQMSLGSIFFTPQIEGEIEQFMGGSGKSFDISAVQARAIVELHELGHGTSRYYHGNQVTIGGLRYDYRTSGKKPDNLVDIYNLCLKGL